MKKIILVVACLAHFVTAFSATTCVTQRTPYFSNSQTDVWSTTLCPHQKLNFHTHTTARIIISDKDGNIQVIYKDGKKSNIALKKDVPVYLSKTQGLKPHEDVNTGNEVLRITVISIK